MTEPSQATKTRPDRELDQLDHEGSIFQTPKQTMEANTTRPMILAPILRASKYRPWWKGDQTTGAVIDQRGEAARPVT